MVNAVNPKTDSRQKCLLCRSCAGRLTLPHLIPCIPRCCRDCLQILTDRQENVSIDGSLCKDGPQITEIRDNEFQTDLYSLSDLAYDTRLELSSQEFPVRICIGCGDTTTVIAYCSKCDDFICESCYVLHVDSNIPMNHRLHTMLIHDSPSNCNLTGNKAMSKIKYPAHRARIPGKEFKTVENEMSFKSYGTLSKHRNPPHRVQESDYNASSSEERERVLGSLMFCKERLLEAFEGVSLQAKENLFSMEIEKQKKLLNDQQRKIEQQLTNEAENLSREKMLIEARLKTKLSEQRKQMKTEIEELREKFDKMKKVAEIDAEIEIINTIHEHEEKKTKLLSKIELLKRSSNKSILLLESKQKEEYASINKMVEQFNSIAGSFEEATSFAMAPPSTKVERNMHSQDEESSKVNVEGFCTTTVQIMTQRNVRLTENGKRVMNLKRSIPDTWTIDQVSGSNRGTVVITGYISGKNLCHRTVINMDGKPLYQCVKKPTPLLGHTCKCLPSSSAEILFLMGGSIGLFDIHQHNTAKRKHIRDVIKRCVTCAAIDGIHNRIIVGLYNDRKVHVFDFGLNHLRTVDIPGLVGYPFDIALRGNSLLICDMFSDRAFAITLPESGRKSEVLYDFTKPDIDAAGSPPWWPLSVCIDNDGFAYILWYQGETKPCQVLQYTQNGGHIVSKLSVHEKAQNIDVVGTRNGQKLIVSTDKNIVVYCLSK